MKIEIKYIYETKDGFKYICDTPEEAINHMEADYAELDKLAQITGGTCDRFSDFTNKYFPKGLIQVNINGVKRDYILRTEVNEL